MIDFDKEMQAILHNDPLGLLSVTAKASNNVSTDERLLAAFEEINAFFAQHGREPAASRDIQERKLYSRLQGLRADPEKALSLQSVDRFGLLAGITLPNMPTIETVADVLDDPLGLLGGASAEETVADSILQLQHISVIPRASSAYVAKRKPCNPAEFAAYEAEFKQVHRELATGKRKLLPFTDKGEQLVDGAYYVLDGILLKMVNVHFTSTEKTVNGRRYRKDGRTYCVFENATESNMLYRSLAKALYQEGYIVTDTEAETHARFRAGFAGVSETGTQTGVIYVLRSLSSNPAILELPYLHKIGFSSQAIAQRLKNAVQEPTYLLAEVEVMAEYQTYDLNPQKLEWLLHTLFAEACLNLDIFDAAGQRHSPREWFVVPLKVIDQAVRLLMTEQIAHYQYDTTKQRLVLRQSTAR
ncbi:GIY-YIG nuclease family protein [Thiothrix subterranea]|uniref:GIY-YIG nuclease family protein n=1 Tax=Thiothrix subterranea TaxID=2735563 RepID=UPI00192C744E|nr:GIY-YIG nuclease family protein [Thiothrix subterranea]